ncbi:hypothetical protein QF037_008953 [Streptomyces canus]|uniref:hypothetical protein n=1 Tax=Streptomyces canus TaxID=58343 RepID=UPI002784760F|nr:hypothetical protein [Streptomyces canus]MDQ0604608.1 hypothetical protein [Streptomyces canus]
MTTPSVKAPMPRNVQLTVVGVRVNAVLNLTVGALLLAVVSNAADQGQGGAPVLAGVVLVLALALLRGFSSAEARNWFDR